MSGGGLHMGATSRWTVDMRPGEMGGDKRAQKEI